MKAFERRHRDQAEVLDEQRDRDVDAGDRQVVAELDPGQADGAEDRQRRKLAAIDAKQPRPDGKEDNEEPGKGEPNTELRQDERRVAQPEQHLDGIAAGGKEEGRQDHQQVAGA